MEFAGRTALVTGAGTGNGEAIAERLFTGGASVGLVSRRLESVDAVCRRIDPEGERTLAIEADVRDPKAMEAAVQRIVERFGSYGRKRHGVEYLPDAASSSISWYRPLAFSSASPSLNAASNSSAFGAFFEKSREYGAERTGVSQYQNRSASRANPRLISSIPTYLSTATASTLFPSSFLRLVSSSGDGSVRKRPSSLAFSNSFP